MTNLSKILIFGKQNVGKSAVFNMLVGKKIAMTLDHPGITRDILAERVDLENTSFLLMDSAGIILSNDEKNRELENLSIKKTENSLKEASLVLFVIDGSEDLTLIDHHCLKILQKTKKTYVVLLNKGDKTKIGDGYWFFEKRKIKTIVTSAVHGRGKEEILSTIESLLKKKENYEKTSENQRYKSDNVKSKYPTIVLLGKPNVGKSSILNCLLKKEQNIISPIPGTTREAVSHEFIFEKSTFIMTDTAGVRKKHAITEIIEKEMVKNTMNAIKKATIIGIVFDINEEKIHDQDITLAMYAFNDLYKPTIIIWNKIDLLKDITVKKKIAKLTEPYAYFFSNLPETFVSSITKKGIENIPPLLKKTIALLDQKIDIGIIDTTIKNSIDQKIIVKNKQKLKIFKTTIIENFPLTICITTNEKNFFDPSILSFLTKQIRKKIDLFGIPIRWVVK